MEYMAFGLPVVAFDLKETRVSAEEAASYVPSGDVGSYAHAIVELLDDIGKREVMGRQGRRRIEEELAWSHQRDAYVDVYDSLVGRTRTSPATQQRGFRLAVEEPNGNRTRDGVRG
jgi:glycosyltransferase involved in cell wall biosynthesis